MKIGVLDIQGSVEEHLAVLKKMKIAAIPVKSAKDLAKINGLIIPGGESTTIGKLMKLYGLDRVIYNRATDHLSLITCHLCIWGTCAGAILLAKRVTSLSAPGKIEPWQANRAPKNLGLIDIEIARNAYGRQLDSFEAEISISCIGRKKFHAIFIRAPQVKKASKKVKVLAEYEGHPVMLRQNNLLVTTFHPELTNDTRIHEYFVSMTKQYV